MRSEFIPACETESDARARAPWAADVIDCDGGFYAFESCKEAKEFRSLHKEKLNPRNARTSKRRAASSPE